MAARKTVGSLLCCAAGLGAALIGCVSDNNRARHALWSSRPNQVDRDGNLKLRQPVKSNIAFARQFAAEGQHDKTRKHFELALKHDSKSVDAILGIARLDQMAGRSAQAEAGFRKALKLEPNNAHALDAFGLHHASRKHWEDAVAMLKKATLAAPNVAEYRYHLAIVLTQSGDFDAAMPHFVATVGGEAAAHYNVGFLLQQQGRLSEAERQFRLALAKQPDLQQARQMLDQLRAGSRRDQLADSVSDDARRQPQINSHIRSASHLNGVRESRSNSPPRSGPVARAESSLYETRRDQDDSPQRSQRSVRRYEELYGGHPDIRAGRQSGNIDDPTIVNTSAADRSAFEDGRAASTNPEGLNPFAFDNRVSQPGDPLTPEQRQQWANQRSANGHSLR